MYYVVQCCNCNFDHSQTAFSNGPKGRHNVLNTMNRISELNQNVCIFMHSPQASIPIIFNPSSLCRAVLAEKFQCIFNLHRTPVTSMWITWFHTWEVSDPVVSPLVLEPYSDVGRSTILKHHPVHWLIFPPFLLTSLRVRWLDSSPEGGCWWSNLFLPVVCCCESHSESHPRDEDVPKFMLQFCSWNFPSHQICHSNIIHATHHPFTLRGGRTNWLKTQPVQLSSISTQFTAWRNFVRAPGWSLVLLPSSRVSTEEPKKKKTWRRPSIHLVHPAQILETLASCRKKCWAAFEHPTHYIGI